MLVHNQQIFCKESCFVSKELLFFNDASSVMHLDLRVVFCLFVFLLQVFFCLFVCNNLFFSSLVTKQDSSTCFQTLNFQLGFVLH